MNTSERRWAAAALVCLAAIVLMWGGIAAKNVKELRARVRMLERQNIPQQTAGNAEIEVMQ